MDDQARSFEERLHAHPQLRGRMEALLTIVEDGNGDVQQADDAEWRVIDALRRLGQEALSRWAVQQEARQSAAVSQHGAVRAGKKNSTGIRRLGK